MSKAQQIQILVRNGLYYLTEHADDEASADGFDIYDVEEGILTGKTRRTWPKEGKYEVVGLALDGRRKGKRNGKSDPKDPKYIQERVPDTYRKKL